MYFAHSSDKRRGIMHPQPYKNHVKNVLGMTQKFLREATRHSGLPDNTRLFMMDVVSLAAIYHDMGKLADQPQAMLRGDLADNNTKMLNHVDAGTAYLLNQYAQTKSSSYLLAALLVHGHHIGLSDFKALVSEERDRTSKLVKLVYNPRSETFRDNRDIFETYGIGIAGKTVRQYIDENLGNFETISRKETGIKYTPRADCTNIPITAFQFRIMFSCLVDADHTDTDNFYSNKNYTPFKFNSLSPKRRRQRLDKHVSSIVPPVSVSKARLNSRRKLYQVCGTQPVPSTVSFFSLDASVGLGKTYSGANYMLRLAEARDCKRIYSIIPFTNIISQTVEDFRNALLLPNEDKNNINEIHSKCEFEEYWMRKYSTRWNAPVNVSTMVQFAESLVSNRPSQCRKLHWFANSVVFFDEFDKSMPHDYWQFVLHTFQDMAENFNVSFIFSSGTSAYYWDIFDHDITVHHIVDKKLHQKFAKLEKERCKIEVMKRPVSNVSTFVNGIIGKLKKVRSGVVVCNTINNACVIADLFRKANIGYEVYELTGWQDAGLKESILAEVRAGLSDPTRKILLVATSTIECGVDISFDTGWREMSGPLSLFQFVGRINRGAIKTDATCYVFRFSESLVGKDCLFTENPALEGAIDVFLSTSKRNLVPKHCTHFVQEELFEKKAHGPGFIALEKNLDFKSIKEEFKVIDSATASVIVNKELAARIQSGDYVAYNEIVRNSVQLWFTKIDKLNELSDNQLIIPIGEDEYYVWNGDYDTQSGIAKTLLLLR